MSSPTAASIGRAAVLFALSGAGALVVEVTWLRWLRELLGATAPAVAATTVAFFAGSAAGAALGAKFVRRGLSPRAALRGYAVLELGAASGALLTPLVLWVGDRLLGAVYPELAGSPAALTAARFALALAATAPTALAYGATWPLIGAAVLPSTTALGSRGSALYAANTAGAALGAGATAWWLPPWLGVAGTYGVGIALALAAAAGAWALARDADASALDAPEVPGPTDAPSASRILAPALAALSGFVALAVQVLGVQAFAQVMNQSVGAFGAVLVAMLASLTVGGAIVAMMRIRGWARPRSILGWSLTLAALGFAGFPHWLFVATSGLEYVGAAGGGAAYVAAVLGIAIATLGPGLLAAACIWPSTLALAGSAAPSGSDDATAIDAGSAAGARLGWLAAANTLGAIGGALVAPFVLIPWLGLWGAFLVVSGVCALAAVALAAEPGLPRWPRDVALAMGWMALLSSANPLSLPLTRTAEGEKLIDQRSGAAGVVSVVERAGERLIRIDNHYALGGTAEQRHEERQGHLPLLLHGAARRVAFVGTATGITAGAALVEGHGVERLHLVEIVPDVARAAEAHFADANRGVYTDARSRVALDDAVNFWRHTAHRFDVVVADLFVPWRAGTGALYGAEHFERIRERLAPGGLFAQWLPLYQLSVDELAVITATFTDVFPTAAVFRGDFFGGYPIVALVGWVDEPSEPSAISAAATRLGASGVGDRWITDADAIWSLYVGPAPVDSEGEISRNTSNRPVIEFLAAARHAGGSLGKTDPVTGSVWIEQAMVWRLAARIPDPLFPALPADAVRAREGGAALQLAGALYVAGRAGESSRALAIAADRLPTHILAEAEADASAAEVWFDPPVDATRTDPAVGR